MGIQIRETKLHIPALRKEWIPRKRLTDLLDGLIDKRLTLVVAPAGYGKTTLLAHFARDTDFPVCWLSLDKLDRDPRRFLAHFIASLTKTFPAISPEVMTTAFPPDQAEIDIHRVTTLLVNEIFHRIDEHFVFIVDDLQFIEASDQAVDFLNACVRVVGENCHLVLASRFLPSLPDLSALIAGLEVGGISLDELAFHPEEVQALVYRITKNRVSLETAIEIAEESEGWITGLLLSAEALLEGPASLRLARVSGVGLYDYLAAEILDRQPAEIREFLLCSSLLGDFNVGLCEKILGISKNWSRFIKQVVEKNLFIHMVGEGGTWYRYHQLFQSFLQATLSRENPALFADLSEKLVKYHIAGEKWDQALAIYEGLENHAASADLILQASKSLVRSGQVLLLKDWLSRLPDEVIDSRPGLLSLSGIISVVVGDVETGLKKFSRAEEKFKLLEDDDQRAVTLSRRMVGLIYRGDYLGALRDATEVENLAIWDQLDLLVKGDVLRLSGQAMARMDRIEEGIERLDNALQCYEREGDEGRIAATYIDLGFINRMRGRFFLARQYYQRSLKTWQSNGNLFNQATLHNNIGVVNHILGEYIEAVESFEAALVCAQRCGFHRMEAMTLASMGDMYGDLDDFEAALDAYHQARSVAYRGEYKSLLLYLDLAEAVIAHRNGDENLARDLITMAEKRLGEIQSGYERGLFHLRAGQLALWEKDYRNAVENLDLAKSLFAKSHRPQERAEINLLMAETKAQMGETEEALIAFDQAVQKAGEMDSSHHLIRVGRHFGPVLKLAASPKHTKDGWGGVIARIKDFNGLVPQLRRRIRNKPTYIQVSPAILDIRGFGKPQVRLGKKVISRAEWKTNSARDLFFYLLANPEGMTKDRIGETLWPDSTAKKIRVNFKNTLYRLRLALGSDIVKFEMDRYWFNRSLDYHYDVDEFLALFEKAQKETDSGKKIEHLRGMISLYRGAYLDGVDRPWVPVEQERLRRIFFQIGEELAQLLLQQQNFSPCLEICRRVLAVDPCHEPMYRHAMTAEVRNGNLPGVVRLYRDCQRHLKETLEVEPSVETRVLYETLTNQS